MAIKIKQLTGGKVTSLVSYDGIPVHRTPDTSASLGTTYYANFEDVASSVIATDAGLTSAKTKTALITVTQAVDLDAIETNLATLSAGYNLIGVAGTQDFGVGIAPANLVPSYIIPMSGCYDKANDNYGNYKCTVDGSIMAWIPKFYFKITHDGGTNINKVDVKGVDTYPTNANAVADGYVIHRMFINAGAEVDGVFVDVTKWSLTNFSYGVSGIASSIVNSNPITSASNTGRDASNNFAGSFANCKSNGQTPTNTYGGGWAAAKSRGNNFALIPDYIRAGLALLSLAHGQASTSTTNCAWYHTTNNFPKGNNNYGADYNDATCTFAACDDAYWASRNEARKNASGNLFAKTTHNGQNNGIADLNGNMYEIMQGITAIMANLTISNVTGDGTYITLQTTAEHGLIANDWVMVAGLQTTITDRLYKVVDAPTTTTIRINSVETAITDVNGALTKGKFYTFKESVDIRTITGGNSLSTSDHFNDAFILANMDEIKLNFANGGVFVQRFGNGTDQVLPFNTDRTTNNYKLSCSGLPDVAGVSIGGSNQFGTDYFYQYLWDELAPLSGAYWNDTSNAGVWCAALGSCRSNSVRNVSARSCLYV